MRDGLPTIGDVITMDDGDELCIIAVDLDAYIWTCVRKITGALLIATFDENRLFQELGTEVDWDSVNDES